MPGVKRQEYDKVVHACTYTCIIKVHLVFLLFEFLHKKGVHYRQHLNKVYTMLMYSCEHVRKRGGGRSEKDGHNIDYSYSHSKNIIANNVRN